MNKNFITGLFTVLSFSVISAQLFAAPLTLKEARQLALESSVEMQTAILSSRDAQLSESAVKYTLFPDLSVSSSQKISSYKSSAYLDPDASTLSAGASLSQPVWDGGIFSLDNKLAGAATEAADAETESVRLSVLSQCDTLFFAYLEAIAQEESAGADRNASDALLEESEVRLESGAISRAAYLEVRSTVAARNAAYYQAKGTRLQAGNDLASFLNLRGLPEISEEFSPQYQNAAASLADFNQQEASALEAKLITAAVQPDVLIGTIQTRQAALSAELDMRQYSPQVNLSLSSSLSSVAGGELTPGSSLSLSGSLGLTRWDRSVVKKQGNIPVHTAELNAREAERQADISIRSAWYTLLSSAGTVVSSTAAEEYAGELYSEMKEMYDLSAVGFSDLKDAEAAWIEARNSSVAAQYDFLNSLSQLTYATGRGDDAFLFQILGLSFLKEQG